MRNVFPLAFAVLAVAASCATGSEPPTIAPAFVQAPSPEQAGRYLFLMGGCNDCHTPGWTESGGKLPESDWAVGNKLGFVGPWGISYPLNLRRSVQEMTEQEWVQMFRQGSGAPPMPWANYRNANEADLVAIYRFIKSLGPRGEEIPDPDPPGTEPTTPYIEMTPKQPARTP
jgi:mono/diheme cytochrome c family protein